MRKTRDDQEAPPRNWGIYWGEQSTGPANSITDVAGVSVGHVSVIRGDGELVPGHGPVRTGVTAIWPAPGNLFLYKVPGAAHVINGFAKCIGLVQLQELGTIETPILITNTLNVGRCADALISYLWSEKNWEFHSINPIVTECNDYFLNDILGRHVREKHVRAALEKAHPGPTEEGNVGAGVGMSCYSFKGGIGTSSRRVTLGTKTHHVGSLVCTNMGTIDDLRVGGLHVSTAIKHDAEAKRPDNVSHNDSESGSIIILTATDVPLDSRQLGRVARRAVNGLARTGTPSESGSGEISIAWTTAYRIERISTSDASIPGCPNDAELDPLFRGVVDSTEEAIINSLWAAKSMIGRDGNVRIRFPVTEVRGILQTVSGNRGAAP